MLDFNTAEQQRPDDYFQMDDLQLDPVQSFLDKMAEYGLHPESIRQDGKLERFQVDGDSKGKESGWYVFFLGDICGGAFGNWRTDEGGNWCSKSKSDQTPEEQRKWAELRAQADQARREEETKNHLATAEKAARIFNAAPVMVGNDNPYLQKKGVQSHGLRVSNDGNLMVPMIDESRNRWNVETTPKDGGVKKGLPGGRRKGLFFEIPGQPGNNDIFICEGYSTGASIHEATGATVICAFNAGNLPHVAPVIKRLYPTHKITIAADNDQYPNKRGEVCNTGTKKAREAALSIGTPDAVIFPTFTQEQINKHKALNVGSKGPTDFNDLALLQGPQAVVEQLAPAKDQIEEFYSGTAFNFLAASENGTDEQKYIFSRPGEKKPGGLRHGVIGYEGGEGGSGKTKLWFQIMASIAFGHDFTRGAFEFYEIGPVLMIAGEDGFDIVAEASQMIRRRASEDKYKIPSELRDNFKFQCAGGSKGSPHIFKRDEGRNIVPNPSFYLLLDKCSQTKPTILCLDSQSVVVGFGEESNEDAGIISGHLKILLKYCLSVVIIAHTTKNSTAAKATAGDWERAWPTALSVEALRGASGQAFNGRYVKMTTKVPQRFNEQLGADKDDRLIACTVPKANGAMEVYEPFYFKQHLYSWLNNQGSRNYGVLWDYYEPPRKEIDQAVAEQVEKEAKEAARVEKLVVKTVREMITQAQEKGPKPGKKGSPANFYQVAAKLVEIADEYRLEQYTKDTTARRQLEKMWDNHDNKMSMSDTKEIIELVDNSQGLSKHFALVDPAEIDIKKRDQLFADAMKNEG
jgi:phage/plasmid primase-like uncharacterized protein